MHASLAKYLTIGAIFLLILISGYLLSRFGKPYGLLLFNLHKLAGLGAAIFVGITAYQLSKIAPLTPAQIAALAACGLAFLLTIVSGGLVSVLAEGGLSNFSPALQAAIQTAHKFLPYLTVVSSGLSLYLLLG